MEKEGFIYLWFDKKRKMYYVGCHWGTIDDGYICSSYRMKQAYKKRPEDFKRRIIQRNIPKKELFIAEEKWLSLIEFHEFGDKYYNLIINNTNHWSSENQTYHPSIGTRISKNKQRKKEERLQQTGSPYTQAQVDNYEKMKGVTKGPQSEEIKRKKSETMKRKIESGEWKPWSTGLKTGPRSEETKEKIRKAVTGKTRTDEQKQIISEGNKQAWSSGKYANRKSNNMKNYIWVRHISDGSVSRIQKEAFDPTKYLLGRKT